MKYFKILKNRNFRLLWMGQLCSGFGDWVYSIALLITLANLKFTGLVIGGSMIIRMLPFILIGPLAGNYIDGKKRKTVMIYSDLLRMVLAASMVLMVLAQNQHWLANGWIVVLIYLISFCSAMVGTFFNPARGALTPNLVEKDDLLIVNSFLSMSNSITLILGPAFGGVLVSLLGVTGVFWLNAATFLFSAVCIFLIKVEEAPKKSGAVFEGLWARYSKGWRIIHADALIAWYTYTSAIRSLIVGVINISFIFVAQHVFPTGREALGWLYSALGLGLLIGSFAIAMVRTKIADKYLYAAAIGANAILSIFYIHSTLWYFSVLALFIVGFSDGFQMVLFDSTIQKRVEPANLGKVFSGGYALILSVQLLSMALGGWLFDVLDYRVIIDIAAACVLLFSLFSFLMYNPKIKAKVESM